MYAELQKRGRSKGSVTTVNQMARIETDLEFRGFPSIAIAGDGPFARWLDGDPDSSWRTMLQLAGLPERGHCSGVTETVARGRRCLAWLVDGQVILGGPPASGGQVAPDDPLPAWELPSLLRQIAAVHDGLGPADGPRAVWWRSAFLPMELMRPLSRHVRFGADNILYDPSAHLLVSTDGRGGGWCLGRDQRARAWSGATHALSSPVMLDSVVASVSAAWST